MFVSVSAHARVRVFMRAPICARICTRTFVRVCMRCVCACVGPFVSLFSLVGVEQRKMQLTCPRITYMLEQSQLKQVSVPGESSKTSVNQVCHVWLLKTHTSTSPQIKHGLLYGTRKTIRPPHLYLLLLLGLSSLRSGIFRFLWALFSLL